MKRQITLILSMIALLFFPRINASNKSEEFSFSDSIMNQVFIRSSMYGKYINEYTAKTYIKGENQILKRNFLLKLAPDFLALNKGDDTTLVEVITDIHYFAPQNFSIKINAVNGTSLYLDDMQKRAMQFLNINLYNATTFNDEVLMPTVPSAFKYYRFSYESTIDTLDRTILKIRVEPKVRSQRLISGYIYVVDKLWIISKIDIRGNWGFYRFHVKTDFGFNRSDFSLPVYTELDLTTNLLGNKFKSRYCAYFQYETILTHSSISDSKTTRFDLSNYFSVRLDTLPVVKESAYWEENRPAPLTIDEQKLYSIKAYKDSLARSKEENPWEFAEKLTAPLSYQDVENTTQLKYSGFLNPLKFSYSSNGFTYWQQLRLGKRTKSGKEFSFNPDFGIVFKDMDFFLNAPLTYLFRPAHMGQIGFSFGNKNQSYNSKIINEINQTSPDSIDFDDYNLEYYKRYFATLKLQHELSNGILGYGGVSYELYIPVKSDDEPVAQPFLTDDANNLISDNYKSFAPFVGLIWTPKQYYRLNGKRKEYLWSPYPTFSIEYARGMTGILGSNSDYERIEADIQQRIPLGLLRSVQYYAGSGVFTNTQSIYFADFQKFARRNFPQSWNDRIGGVFQLLDRNWYNASDFYIQFHAMYESPFMLLQLFRGVAKDIVKERFYFSQLYTPALPSYTELGYGVGNFLINAGIFVGFEKGEFESCGFRFSFELGR